MVYNDYLKADCPKKQFKVIGKLLHLCFKNIPNQEQLLRLLGLPLEKGPVLFDLLRYR